MSSFGSKSDADIAFLIEVVFVEEKQSSAG
jgi:hypothetical protein